MTAQADDFDDLHLPIEITVESYQTLLLLIASNEPNVLMPTISALRDQIKDESIVNSTIPRLVELANTLSNDQVLTVIAWYFAALAQAAVTEKWAFDVLSKSGAVPHIVKFSKQFDHPSLSERTFEALVALSSDPVTSREIIENGSLDVFKEALKRDDPTIQSQVSIALYRMSTDFENRRSILKSGLFDSLIDFLSSEDLDEEVLSNALQATGNILIDSECVVHFEERSGWNHIYPYLEESEKTIQTYAYSIVAQVSSVPSFQYHFDEDLLGKFIVALNDLEEFDPVVPKLLQIFKNCCGITIVARNLALQVPFLLDRVFSSQTEVSIKESMTEIISNLSKDPNTHSSILESDQLVRICKLLGNEILLNDNKRQATTRIMRKNALQVINSVCENRSIRAKLHEFSAIEHMVTILHSSTSGEESENDLLSDKANMSEQSESDIDHKPNEKEPMKPEVGNEYGWRVEIQMVVLPILFKMIGDSKLQQILIEKSIGDIEVLISSDYPDILNTALLILATIAVDDTARTDISKRPKFMQTLINLITNKKVAIRRNALHAINSLSMKSEISIQFCGFGLIEKLKKFASSSAMINLNLSAFATTALETLCSSNIVAKYWVKDILDFGDSIQDGFYSIDPRSEKYQSIDALLSDVIHLRIEALLLDQHRDPGLVEAVTALADSFSVKVEPSEVNPPKKKPSKKNEIIEPQVTVVIPEWPHIAVSVAQFVIHRMGGPFEGGRIPYEADVSRCKYKTHSDVVMLGQLQVGAIRHRALLFKYLAQLYGMEVLIKRNREDLSCEVKVKKGNEIFNVSLSGDVDILKQ